MMAKEACSRPVSTLAMMYVRAETCADQAVPVLVPVLVVPTATRMRLPSPSIDPALGSGTALVACCEASVYVHPGGRIKVTGSLKLADALPPATVTVALPAS